MLKEGIGEAASSLSLGYASDYQNRGTMYKEKQSLVVSMICVNLALRLVISSKYLKINVRN